MAARDLISIVSWPDCSGPVFLFLAFVVQIWLFGWRNCGWTHLLPAWRCLAWAVVFGRVGTVTCCLAWRLHFSAALVQPLLWCCFCLAFWLPLLRVVQCKGGSPLTPSFSTKLSPTPLPGDRLVASGSQAWRGGMSMRGRPCRAELTFLFFFSCHRASPFVGSCVGSF